MKFFILAGALLLSTAASSLAQTTYGIKGGLNISTVRWDRNDVKATAGFHVGGFVSAPISGLFALQPEVLYSQQGFETDVFKYRYHYLNVPLIFKGTIAGGLHAQLGPQFGILIRANRVTGKLSEDITESKNKFDGALALGLGYDVSSLHFSARYNLGLSDTRQDGNGFSGHTNNVFQLSVGIRL